MTSYGDVRQMIKDTFMIVEFCKGIRNAQKDIQYFQRQARDLEELMKRMEHNWNRIENDDEVQRLFAEITSSILEVQKQLSTKPRRCQKLLTPLTWLRTKATIQLDIDRIDRLRNGLSNLMQSIYLADLQEGQQQEKVEGFIKDWTPAISTLLSDVSARIQVTEGTGNWLHQSTEYQDWISSKHGMLWVNGIPRAASEGCGKTGLAASLTEHLATTGAHAVSVFCYHATEGMRNLASPMEIIMSLWAQLIKLRPECRPTAGYIKEIGKGSNPSALLPKQKMKYGMDLFKDTIAQVGSVILILDGLDEVPQRLQACIVRQLRELQQRSRDCRILVTSRPYESIARMFKGDPQLQMITPKIELELYMRDRFSQDNWDDDPQLTITDIIDALIPNCQGLFLLAQLFMDEVLRAESIAQCKRIIAQPPQTVDQAYERGLDRLKQEYSAEVRKDGLPCRAIQSLFWVAFAKSPMTGDQLRQALAIDDGDVDFDPRTYTWRGGGIDTATGRLVLSNPQNGELFVAHKSLTEYLTKKTTYSALFPRIEEHIPKVLLQFLLFDAMKETTDSGTELEFLERYPLLPYALGNWGEGLKALLKPDTFLWSLACSFLGASFDKWNDHVKNQIIKAFEKKRKFENRPRELFTHEFFTPGNIDGLYWVVLFDLQELAANYIDPGKECLVQDPVPTTPLGLASASNNLEMMQLLLDSGSKVNLSPTTNRLVKPPLHDAVWQRETESIEMLLKQGADLTCRRGVGDKSPLDLLYAFVYLPGQYRSAQILASHISGKSETKAQELQFLIRGGFTLDLARAISEGLDVNHPCENAKMALDYAMEMGNQKTIELLVNCGARANLRWPAEEMDSCPFPLNFPTPSISPIAEGGGEFKGRDYSTEATQEDLILEIPVRTQQPIRSIVFETVTSDQGWSDYKEIQGTYLGGDRSRLDFVVERDGWKSQRFVIQDNLHACKSKRLHTNIWNLNELEATSPAKAELIQSIEASSKVQVYARAYGRQWACFVAYVRVRMYGEELKA